MRAAPFLPFALLVSLLLPWRELDAPAGAFYAPDSASAFELMPIVAILMALLSVGAVFVALRLIGEATKKASRRAAGLARAYLAISVPVAALGFWLAVSQPSEWPEIGSIGLGLGAFIGLGAALAMVAVGFHVSRETPERPPRRRS
jgi:hypothetical protein